ncbi:MAG: DUF3095 domain-containing protein [Pseudomonadota bacterium]
MNQPEPANAFYLNAHLHEVFGSLADAALYSPLPDTWWVGTSDISGSTRAVSEGKYKSVNMIAAAVISAQINAHEGADFPYIFGGDGAGFAIPPEWRAKAESALAAVRSWARQEFGLELRIGMIPVTEIRQAGFDVSVARFRVSEGADYAMFTGGGLSWAETHMKAGAQTIADAPAHVRPDLTGLSCRWNHMPSRHGSILSLVVLPCDDAPGPAFSDLAGQIADIVEHLDRAGHPADEGGPGATWPPAGATLEAHAQRGDGPLSKAWRKALFESGVAWLLIKTGVKIGGFDARRYQMVVGQNADFRKFEDGLKMTLDCDAETERRLLEILDKGTAEGVIRYGVHRQNEAMMTCIVPSIMTDNHVHFVDGAAGGYTEAARTLKT